MKKIAKYWFLFQTQMFNSLAYPAELIGRSMLMIPFMWIFAQLWKVMFSTSSGGLISGLSLAQTLWYLMMAETIELSRPRLSNTIADAVKDGSIAYILNRPYDFLLYHLSTSLGETVFRAAMNALIGSAVVWWLAGPPPSAWGFVVVIPALVGAWLVNFCISAVIGLAAFVTEDVNAFTWIYQKFIFILGGLLIPLDFYPAWLQSVARALPFSAMLYGPARLFVSPEWNLFAAVLGTQLAWTAALGLGAVLVYRRGLASLVVNGG